MVEAIIGVLALLVGVLCAVSGVYIWYVYRQRKEDALFLTRLVHRDIRISIASGVIAVLIAYAYLQQPLPRPWGAIITGSAIMVMMFGPIGDALLWRKERAKK